MKKHRKPVQSFNFTAMHELMADPINPVSPQLLGGHLARVNAALKSLAEDADPSRDAWRDLSDAVNILESLQVLGYINDEGQEIIKAKDAMGQAGARALEGGKLRLTGPGIATLRNLLDDYAEIVQALSARQFIKACRTTERRVREILRGVKNQGDRVIAL